ncbi:hypothetical protein AB5I41_31415 [Sphingomonas sp. MMS24-JH45]
MAMSSPLPLPTGADWERLTAALLAVNSTLIEHHDEVKKLNGHLEQERHDREIAKAVREAVEREKGKL